MKEKDRLDVPFLQRLFPRLQAWYDWFNKTQEGPHPLTYRWKGRNATTDRELNPKVIGWIRPIRLQYYCCVKTLTSGLDDYPRASHPSNDEYHLDLRCWMTVASATMATIADIIGGILCVKEFHKIFITLVHENTTIKQLITSYKHVIVIVWYINDHMILFTVADSKPYNSYYKLLSDNDKLNQLHWDPTKKV